MTSPEPPDLRLPDERRWTFLSNHAHVLVCLALNPSARVRDLAEAIGITERGVQRILSELEQEGLLTRQRSGRRNVYRLTLDHPLRHPLESHRTVAELVQLFQKPQS
jgi:DNA-binding transcriptional ArsR family regulator